MVSISGCFTRGERKTQNMGKSNFGSAPPPPDWVLAPGEESNIPWQGSEGSIPWQGLALTPRYIMLRGRAGFFRPHQCRFYTHFQQTGFQGRTSSKVPKPGDVFVLKALFS